MHVCSFFTVKPASVNFIKLNQIASWQTGNKNRLSSLKLKITPEGGKIKPVKIKPLKKRTEAKQNTLEISQKYKSFPMEANKCSLSRGKDRWNLAVAYRQAEGGAQ